MDNQALRSSPPIVTRVLFFNDDSATISQWNCSGGAHNEFCRSVESGFKPTHWIELPSNDDPRWIQGNPKYHNDIIDKQLLTLSPFAPNGRIGFSIEVKTSLPFSLQPNYPPFEGVIAWMRVDDLRDSAHLLPTLHELRHGAVDELDGYHLGDLVTISFGSAERLGRVMSLTHKQIASQQKGDELVPVLASAIYVAELGRDETHTMTFDINSRGQMASFIHKVDTTSIVAGYLREQGEITAQFDEHVGWQFMNKEGETIDEACLFGMKVKSIEYLDLDQSESSLMAL